MKRTSWLIAISSFALLSLATVVIAAAAAPMSININSKGVASLQGTIASISGTTLTINSWGGAWNIDASTAKIVRRFGGTANLPNCRQAI